MSIYNIPVEIWLSIFEEMSIFDILKLMSLDKTNNQKFKDNTFWSYLLRRDFFDAFNEWEKSANKTSAHKAYVMAHEMQYGFKKEREGFFGAGIYRKELTYAFHGDFANVKTSSLSHISLSALFDLFMKMDKNGFTMLQKISRQPNQEVKDYFLNLCSYLTKEKSYSAFIDLAIIFNKDYKYVTSIWSDYEESARFTRSDDKKSSLAILNPQSPSHIDRFNISAAYNNFSMVEYFLDCDFDVNNFCEKRKDNRLSIDFYSSLHAACYGGHPKMVTFLLEKGADIHRVNNQKQTPLYIACKYGHSDVVEILLNNKARLTEKLLTADNSEVYVSVANGHKACLERLLAHLKENKTDFKSITEQLNTLLFLAVKQGYPATTKLLCQYGADANASQDKQSPLSIAISQENAEVASVLLEHGADIKKLEGFSIIDTLTKACKTGMLPVVKLMAKLLPNVNAVSSKKGSPLYIAASKGYLPIVQYLFSLGVDINKGLNEESPLYVALKNKQTKVAKFLIENNADTSLGGNNLPIHEACLLYEPELMQAILTKHPEMIEARNDANKTPLLIVAEMGTTPTMKCLIHAKADVNATNSRDERTGKHTALHFIAERGAVEIIELLLKNGANPTLKTIDNKTAAALADKCAKSRMLIIDAMREWEKNRTLKNNGDILPESEDMGMRHI